MPIRTEESLQRLFEASRLRNEKKKRLQEQKYKKAKQAVKKALGDKLSTDKEKTPQNDWKQPQIELSRTIRIYNVKYIERFADDDDLYQTREELMEAERRGEGKINWDKWDELVNKTRKELEK